MSGHNIAVMAGFLSGLKVTDQGVIINVDVSHRVLRDETVLQFMNQNKGSRQNIMAEIVGRVVMTRYNKQTYKVTSIDFNLTPKNTFLQRHGEEISYVDYYKQKYGVTIKDLNQCLLVHEHPKTKMKIVLVPELCSMTGISDQMRNNFKLMKDLAQITNVPSSKRLEQCKNLFKIMQENENCKMELEKWNVILDSKPLSANGKSLDSGRLVMGTFGGRTLSFDPKTPEIDRQTQNMMYEQPQLDKWAVFYTERDCKEYKQFMSILQETAKTCKYSTSMFIHNFKNLIITT